MKTIIVGVDGAEPSKRAARQAVELAERLGAELHLVTVARPSEPSTIESGSDRWVVSDRDVAAQRLQEYVASLDTTATIHTSTVEGPPAKALIAEAERVAADLIVVGNRRMQGASRVLGSVGSDVLKHAPCAVLVSKTT